MVDDVRKVPVVVVGAAPKRHVGTAPVGNPAPVTVTVVPPEMGPPLGVACERAKRERVIPSLV
jgi:hypothetical protein